MIYDIMNGKLKFTETVSPELLNGKPIFFVGAHLDEFLYEDEDQSVVASMVLVGLAVDWSLMILFGISPRNTRWKIH